MTATHAGEPAATVPSHATKLLIPFVEFVALMALLMAMTALSIDIMLPALPDIGAALRVTQANDRQWVIAAYFLGFGPAQLIYGPLSDRFGRKPVLFAGLALYLAGGLYAASVSGFSGLLFARALQGFGAAAPRVMAVAIVRDCFKGREMARVMSFTMMTFIIMPILAPSIGQGLLQIGSWRLIFWFLVFIGALAMIWAMLRLPETERPTQPADKRLSLLDAFLVVVRTRQSLGYTITGGFLFGALFGYLLTCQQIFVEIYGLGARFPLAFGSLAAFMGLASFLNATLVRRMGMRRITHLALCGFTCFSVMLVVVSLRAPPPFALFCFLVSGVFFNFQLAFSNLNAITMQPLGHVAGTAASVVGCYTTTAAALFGRVIGARFDGTVLPLAIGFAVLGLAALTSVVWTEGRHGLFKGE